ncbi:MAG TPA: hypothetical protein PLQ35_02765 [bacterium]|nr:hypothetical protein [bacterium]HQL61194.1 hypothetical protein [bacterium]
MFRQPFRVRWGLRFCCEHPSCITAGFVLLIRLPFFWAVVTKPECALMPDSVTYIAIADNLTDPSIHRTPGYPLFLAAIRCVSYSPISVAMVQSFLAAVTGILVTCIAYRLSPSGNGSARLAGILAGIFFAADAVSAGYSCLVLTESLCALVLTTTVALFVLSPGSPGQIIGVGILNGLNALIRPVAMLCVIAQLPYGYVKIRSRRYGLALLIAFSFLLPGIWILRNGLSAGVYTLSDIAIVNLYFYRAAAIVAELKQLPFEEVQQSMREEWNRELTETSLTQTEQLQRIRSRAITIIYQHPDLAMKHAAIGLVKMLFGPGRELYLRFFHSVPPLFLTLLLAYSLVHIVVVYLCAGMYFYRSKRPEKWLFFLTILYFCLFSMGPEAYSRFRVPIMPLFCITAGLGIPFRTERMGDKIAEEG